MLRISVGSLNPVKLEAVRKAFTRFFPGQEVEVTGFAAESGVSAQPMTDDETRTGALNRCAATAAAHPSADFTVGLEGGCAESSIALSLLRGSLDTSGAPSISYLECFAWMAVCEPRTGRFGCARTGSFQLPAAVADLVRAGVELGLADDRVFGRSNSKHGEGAVGLLTRGVISRSDYYEHALLLALVPFGLSEYYTPRSEDDASPCRESSTSLERGDLAAGSAS